MSEAGESRDEARLEARDERILEGLLSEDADEVNRAYRLLTDDLLGYARGLLRTRFNQVNLQEGSVVQSAVASLYEKGADRFENEDHLQGRMRLAVLRKIQDRIKARKNRMVQQPEEGGYENDPGNSGPGIATRIADGECAFDVGALLLNGLDSDDRNLVELGLLQNLDRKTLGQRLGLSDDAVRQRLSRLRPRLRASMLEPVRRRVHEDEWTVLNLCFVKKMSAKAAATELGLTEAQLAMELYRLVEECVKPMVGESGCDLLVRLIGRSKI